MLKHKLQNQYEIYGSVLARRTKIVVHKLVLVLNKEFRGELEKLFKNIHIKQELYWANIEPT
jgi:hypothetical protein